MQSEWPFCFDKGCPVAHILGEKGAVKVISVFKDSKSHPVETILVLGWL